MLPYLFWGEPVTLGGQEFFQAVMRQRGQGVLQGSPDICELLSEHPQIIPLEELHILKNICVPVAPTSSLVQAQSLLSPAWFFDLQLLRRAFT